MTIRGNEHEDSAGEILSWSSFLREWSVILRMSIEEIQNHEDATLVTDDVPDAEPLKVMGFFSGATGDIWEVGLAMYPVGESPSVHAPEWEECRFEHFVVKRDVQLRIRFDDYMNVVGVVFYEGGSRGQEQRIQHLRHIEAIGRRGKSRKSRTLICQDEIVYDSILHRSEWMNLHKPNIEDAIDALTYIFVGGEASKQVFQDLKVEVRRAYERVKRRNSRGRSTEK